MTTKRTKISRPAVSALHCDSIHTIPSWVSWSDLPYDSRGDKYAYVAYEAMRCEECGALVVLSSGQGGEAHKQLADTDCTGYVSTCEGPMMSYCYPLPDNLDPYDAAPMIAHLPLCLIEWNESSGREGWALALTG